MRRVETIQKTQTMLAELGSKYGLALPASQGESFLAKAKRLNLPRDVLNKTVIPCQLELLDQGRANPALIVPHSLPAEMYPVYKRLAVGGQVQSLASSEFTLPKHILEVAWRPVGIWQGGPMPILASILGDYRYLIRPNSLFFRCGKYTGRDLDSTSPSLPDELGLKRGRYAWSDDFANDLTVVVADF